MTNTVVIRDNCLDYSRISTDEQNSQSCDDQSNISKRYILSIGKKLAPNGSYRDEGIPGSTLDRAGLQDLLIRCEKDPTIYAVVTTETDRAARGNLAFITIREALKKCGVKLIAVTQPMINDTEEGELIGEVFGAINGFFSKITRRKSMRALDEKANRGWWPGKAPLFYKNVNVGTEEKPDRIIVVDEEKKPYGLKIPTFYNQGLSYQEISDKLFDQGLRGMNKGKCHQKKYEKLSSATFTLGNMFGEGQDIPAIILRFLIGLKFRKHAQGRRKNHTPKARKICVINFYSNDCRFYAPPVNATLPQNQK